MWLRWRPSKLLDDDDNAMDLVFDVLFTFAPAVEHWVQRVRESALDLDLDLDDCLVKAFATSDLQSSCGTESLVSNHN